MGSEALRIFRRPRVRGLRMVLSFSGWMDGGEVSTGTVGYMREKLNAAAVAEIEPKGFYIYNFPGSMEVTTLFRPHTEIKEGEILKYEPPANVFYCSDAHQLVLFEGKEPNTNWEDFADCLFDAASELAVGTIYFLGSYAGVVPHTREPHLYTTVSRPVLKEELQPHGLRFSNYEGPAGVVTYLTKVAADRGIRMASVVAEIPAYFEGRNPRCIEAVIRKLCAILELEIDLDEINELSRSFETQVTRLMKEKDDLAEMVRKLETQYDTDYLETEMGDLKQWLEDQGFHMTDR